MAVVLVIEDEVRIAELLARTLRYDGHEVHTAPDGTNGLRIALTTPIDLVILDLRLPGITGEEVAARLRATSPVPILMLTAKVTEQDRIAGLEAGADDYVTKPFSPREVALRVNAILRRGRPENTAGLATYGGGLLTIWPDEHRVEALGKAVELTPTEWELLAVLTGRAGRVWTRYELVTRIRGYEYDGFERTIDSHIKNLRRKIEVDPRQPVIIETVTNVGYRIGVTRDP